MYFCGQCSGWTFITDCCHRRRHVCDGPIRPISKQATNKRIADKELSRIKAYLCRAKVVELKNRLVQESLNQEERDAITGEIRKFDTQMKRIETQSQCCMPNNFASHLEYELNHSNAHTVDEESAGGYVDHVVVAEFQADSYMAAQIIDRAAIMVMTKDSDIPIIAGDCCISIKSFTKGKFEIVCTSEATLNHALSYLSEASKEKVQFKAAVNPVFEGICYVRLRALIMLMLGCDVFIPGMKAVNSLTAMVPYMEPLFFELHTSLISFRICVRCQRLIARNLADGFLFFSLADTF